MKNIEKIKILGAGISGLSSGIILSKNNYTVSIFEKESHVGGRFKKDFQCIRNYGTEFDPIKEFKKFGLNIKPLKKINRIIRYSNNNNFEVYSKKKPLFYLFSRGKQEGSIDIQLKNRLTKFGGDINFKSKLNKKDANIISCGPRSFDTMAYGGIYEDSNIDDSIHLFLNRDIPFLGYLYAVPGKNDGEVEIINGIYSSNITVKEAKNIYEKIISKKKILKNFLKGAKKKHTQIGYGSFNLMKKPYFKNQYYIGESAGLQDKYAGFGIRYAVLSGCIAAKCIIENLDYNQQFNNMFKERLDKENERSLKFKNMNNKDLDKIFKKINQSFDSKIEISDYEKIREML